MKSCLVVEDSALIREIAVRIVKDLGLEPLQAGTFEDGVAICREKKPDAVLLDWDLPSFGALDFLRGLGDQDASARPPIILCATEFDPQQFTLAKAAGAAFHLLKPFDARIIAEKLADVGVIAASAVPPIKPQNAPRDRAAS